MVPLVTLQLTVTLAESPVSRKATAVKSAVAFGCKVSVLGEMTRWLIVPPPGPVTATGLSQANTVAMARSITTAIGSRSFSSARR